MGGLCKERKIECSFCSKEFSTRANPSNLPEACSQSCVNNLRYGSIENRIKKYSKKQKDCIIWTGSKDNYNYGTVTYNGKVWRAHRLVYTLNCGPIPESMVIMHSCDNPSCIKLEHLSLGSIRDNVIDMAVKERHWKISISKSKVNEIIKRYNNGEKGKDLAVEFNTSPSTISRYVNGVRRNV